MTCPAPAPCGPVPSARQLAWHRHEFYGFVHFTVNTFTDKEWGYGDETPAVFNPATLDVRQWTAAAREAGMAGLVLTCKHHDGFCLWPSRFTEHSVKHSPWRGGHGDLVHDLAEACRDAGLRFGVYLSPWDRNHPAYGRPEYVTYYRNQLRELLTQYGPLFEVWFDGANGGDGFYGGARETRTIDRTRYYGWPETWAMVRELQPDAVMFSDAGPDIRWVGNEDGVGSDTTWATINAAGWAPGQCTLADLGPGHEDGSAWLPPETDVSIRPGWFYHAHEDDKVKSVAKLLEIYHQSVGRGTSLLLNIPPDRRGLWHETDVERLRGFRQARDRLFARDLARDATAGASATRGDAGSVCAPACVCDGSPDTFWAAPDGVTQAEVTLAFPRPVSLTHAVLQEQIALGQRVQEWRLGAETGGVWCEVARGTTIGYKRIVRFPTVTAARLRLQIRRAKACPTLATFAAYGPG